MKGNAVAGAAKKVTTSDSRGSVSETASKYHQSKVELVMLLTWGLSRARRESVGRVWFGVGMWNLAWLGPSCAVGRMVKIQFWGVLGGCWAVDGFVMISMHRREKSGVSIVCLMLVDGSRGDSVE